MKTILIVALMFLSVASNAQDSYRKKISARIIEMCVYGGITDSGLLSGKNFEPFLRIRNNNINDPYRRKIVKTGSRLEVAPGECIQNTDEEASKVSFVIDSNDPYMKMFKITLGESGLLSNVYDWDAKEIMVQLPGLVFVRDGEYKNYKVISTDKLPATVRIKTEWGYGKVYISEE